jgi:photosystem II stability/assembly factor-like uncharacterized protein
VVAVGQRGRIVFSDDGGATWTQAAVPVEVDLVGVVFPLATTGWAVGHGGVVLVSRDAGATWTSQLAGKQADALALRHYAGRTSPTPEEAHALERARAQLLEPRAQPFLDVTFEGSGTGFVGGAFNTLFRTEDGGNTWMPWMDRTANPQDLHFNAVRGRPGSVFLAGEQGMVWRLRRRDQRFAPVPTPYKGTLFGLVVAENSPLLAFGMRGTAWRSLDEGDSWRPARLESSAGITGGIALADGRIALVDLAGMLHLSRDEGRTFTASRPAPAVPWYAVAAGRPGTLVLAGAGATRIVAVP